MVLRGELIEHVFYPIFPLESAATSTSDIVVVPLAAYVQTGRSESGLVVGYGAATPDQFESGIAAIANAFSHRRP